MVSFPPVSPPRPYTPPLSSPIHATCPAHLILLHFITRTILGEEYKSFSSSLCNLIHSPVTSSLLGPNILLNTMFSNTLSFLSSHNVNDQVSHPYKTTGKIIVTQNAHQQVREEKSQGTELGTDFQKASPTAATHKHAKVSNILSAVSPSAPSNLDPPPPATPPHTYHTHNQLRKAFFCHSGVYFVLHIYLSQIKVYFLFYSSNYCITVIVLYTVLQSQILVIFIRGLLNTRTQSP